MHYSIGIDIGATKIKGVVANDKGAILTCVEMPTNAKRSGNAILGDVFNLIECLKSCARKAHLKLEGIGVGAPGLIKDGKLVFGGGTLAQLTGFDLAGLIKKVSGLKAVLQNDAMCFVLAESYLEQAGNTTVLPELRGERESARVMPIKK